LTRATIFFLAAALVTAAIAFLLVGRMARQLGQSAPTGRKTSLLLDLPSILREHHRLFPQSGPMLAFWLAVIFLLVWTACSVFSWATRL